MTNENTENTFTFTTERLPLAVFLHASQRLHLSHTQVEGGRVKFVFADPEQIGDEAELAFENGESVSAKSLFASQTFLRRRMTDARDQNRKDDNRNSQYAYYRR